MIKPQEVDYIEEIGDINGQPVKIIRTVGGFFTSVGKLGRDTKDSVLAAGSHPAIVKFQLEKKYGKSFRQTLNKSESGVEPIVSDKSKFLSKELSEKGYDIYMLVEGSEVSAVVSKYGNEVIRQEGLLKADSLEIFPEVSFGKIEDAQFAGDNGISQSIVLAMTETAKDMNKSKIAISSTPKTLDVNKVLNGKK